MRTSAGMEWPEAGKDGEGCEGNLFTMLSTLMPQIYEAFELVKINSIVEVGRKEKKRHLGIANAMKSLESCFLPLLLTLPLPHLII